MTTLFKALFKGMFFIYAFAFAAVLMMILFFNGLFALL